MTTTDKLIKENQVMYKHNLKFLNRPEEIGKFEQKDKVRHFLFSHGLQEVERDRVLKSKRLLF